MAKVEIVQLGKEREQKTMEILMKKSFDDSGYMNTAANPKTAKRSHDKARVKSKLSSKDRSISKMLQDSESMWKSMVESYSDSFSADDRREIISRFNRLSEAGDWGFKDLPVTRESARTFMELLRKLKPEKLPQLGCDHGGNVSMMWGSREEYLDVLCFPRNKAIFYVAYRENDKTVKFCGQKLVSEIIKDLNKHKSLRMKFFAKGFQSN